MSRARWVCAMLLGVLGARADYGWRTVEIGGGGYVSGVEFHPRERGLVYARTDVGGAYRLDAASGRWIALNDDIGGLDNEFMQLGVLSVAPDPGDADRVYLACGQYVEWWAPNAWLLRSADRGATWARTGLPFKLAGNQDGRGTGERLAVDPHDGARLLLGTNRDGLWRSLDRGATWTRLTSFAPAGTTFVRFDPRAEAAGLIYVGVNSTAGDSLWRSTDGGGTWTTVAGQPTGLMALQGALDAAGTLYLTYADAFGPNGVTRGAVWKRTSGGDWTNISPPAGQGGFGGVSVSGGVVAVSTLCRWSPQDEIYRSTNGGATWTGVLAGAPRDHASAPWSAGVTPHWITDVELDPFDATRARFVTGYGVLGTDEFTVAGRRPGWFFASRGLEETVPLGLLAPAEGPELVSVIGDYDGFRHDNLNTSPTRGRHVPAHGTSRSLDGAGLAPAVMARTHARGGAVSRDGGASWAEFATSPTGAELTDDNSRVAVGADGVRVVWCGPGGVARVTANDGAGWAACAGAPTAAGGLLLPAADRVNAARFYLFDPATRRVSASADGGASFAVVSAALPSGVARLHTAPGREGELWAAAGDGGLLRSVDGGAGFAALGAVQRAYQVGFGRAAAGATFPTVFIWGRVAGVTGIFRSDDVGVSWVRINDDARQFGHVNELTGDPRVYGRVYLATSGRGVVVGEPDPQGYVAWREENFGDYGAGAAEAGAWTADPDADGRVNGLEWALGGDPRSADARAWARVEPAAEAGEAGWSVSYDARERLGAWRLVLEESVDLRSWAEVAPGAWRTSQAIDEAGAWRRHAWWFAAGGRTRWFARVRLE